MRMMMRMTEIMKILPMMMMVPSNPVSTIPFGQQSVHLHNDGVDDDDDDDQEDDRDDRDDDNDNDDDDDPSVACQQAHLANLSTYVKLAERGSNPLAILNSSHSQVKPLLFSSESTFISSEFAFIKPPGGRGS